MALDGEMGSLLESVPKKIAAAFAADCAARVLPLFEAAYPTDDRPRQAIEVARSGAPFPIVRATALAAHAAARTARDDGNGAATDAARAAGHAVATHHVTRHAIGAAGYAALASADPGELDWQLTRLRQLVARSARAVMVGADTVAT
jgi:hypothetical protein